MSVLAHARRAREANGAALGDRARAAWMLARAARREGNYGRLLNARNALERMFGRDPHPALRRLARVGEGRGPETPEAA